MARAKYRYLVIGGVSRAEHIALAEKALGHSLPPGAEVHHVDGDGWNNAPSNLVICPDRAYHFLLHARQRAMDATGDPAQRPCRRCGKYDKIENMSAEPRKEGYSDRYRHSACEAAYAAARRAKKVLAASAAALALVACGGGGGGAGVVVTAAPPPVATPAVASAAVGVCSVEIWGDSIAALTAPRLATTLQVDLHAVVGGTAQDALAAFLQDPLAARFIVIEYGTNDANAGSDLEVPVRSMLQWADAKGRTVVLTGTPHEVAGEVAVEANYNLWLSTLGRAYADWPGVAYAGPSDLMADGVHPADAYQQRLADALSKTIENLAPECSNPG
jgi:lysophospholipase L1-like esterase